MVLRCTVLCYTVPLMYLPIGQDALDPLGVQQQQLPLTLAIGTCTPFLHCCALLRFQFLRDCGCLLRLPMLRAMRVSMRMGRMRRGSMRGCCL